MTTEKVATPIDRQVLKRLDRLVAEKLFPNRSRAIQEAVEEQPSRLDHTRLAREAGKVDRRCEQKPAGEGLAGEAQWPES